MISQEKLNEVKRTIREAVQRAKEKGLTIISGDWSVDFQNEAWVPLNGCCCPMGAVLVGTQDVEAIYVVDAYYSAAKILGVETEDIAQFVGQFDDQAPLISPREGDYTPIECFAYTLRKELGFPVDRI